MKVFELKKGGIMAEVTVPQTATTWWAKIKTTLGLDKLHISKEMLIYVVTYLNAGFVVGFLMKRLRTYLLALLFAVIFLLILNQMDLISLTVHVDKVREFFGLQPMGAQVNLMQVMWDWAKEHIVYVLSFMIGFLVGLKIS